MKKREIEPYQIADILKENLHDKSAYFVFATDVVLNSWAEWCVRNPEKSGVRAVSLERFLAWDTFKENYATAEQTGKQSIPAVLRKIFVHNLIAENKECAKNGKPLFKSIIHPHLASEAEPFVDWISKNIPFLKTWHNKFMEYEKENPGSADDEDSDYELLYSRYLEFLGENMFEPAWLEPNFTERNKRFYIFFPEQLEDFDEYHEVFADFDNVVALTLPKEKKSEQQVYVYPDARKELRRTALCIRHLVGEKSNSATYSDIAVHVPDLETYRPYIAREFEKYCIPFVIRSGESYTVNNAGTIFENISECVQNQYSYNSVRTLLLNGFVPWKEKDVNLSLVREGCRLHCVCNYEKPDVNDIWIEALSASGQNVRELSLYENLKKAAESIYYATTFKNLMKAWEQFKKDFLVNDEFSESANKILGRCITELSVLCDIENDFIEPRGLTLKSPFLFFLNELRTKTYRPQEKINGVSVFDYKVAAASAFRYSFVLNCTQNALTVARKKFSFLNSQKRAALEIVDSDLPSLAFIRLYDVQSAVYSCSEQSFSGFAIPHNALVPAPIEKGHTPFEELDNEDFVKNEEKWFIYEKEKPSELSLIQKKQFDTWISHSDFDFEKIPSVGIPDSVEQKIDNVLKKLRGRGESANLMKITQSDMDNFFPCPRKWLLKNVLKLQNDTLDISLFGKFDQGNINHKVLELLFTALKKVPVFGDDETFGNDENSLTELVKAKINETIHSPEMSFHESPLIIKVLESQTGKIQSIIMKFLRVFCRPEMFGGKSVIGTEKWVEAPCEGKNYALSGKIDCLLSTDNGDVSIIDYKNSSVPSKKSLMCSTENTLDDFQAAMYISLWNKNNEAVPVSDMTFCSIKNPGTTSGSRTAIDAQADDLETTLELFEQYTDSFYKAVDGKDLIPSAKKAPFNKLEVYSDCSQCDFKTICRHTYSVAGHKL